MVKRATREQGQVGIIVVFTMIVVAAAVAWAVAAMATPSSSSATAVPRVAPAPAASPTNDALNPETAPAFKGPKYHPYDASVQAPLSGRVHNITLDIREKTLEVADGKFMHLWMFGGTVPGPVIHVTQGDTIHFKLVNKGTMPHSMDFHAAEIAPNRAYVDVQPGKSFQFDWVASQPGVFMYHCASQPVLQHIGNGMYGMVIVDPKGQRLPRAREYAIVQSELYFGGQAKVGSLEKMTAEEPDWIVFNGHADQYVDHPLTAKVGERVRLYILNAGPSKWSAFHVIGTIFDHTLEEGVVGGPAQTINIAPSQGAMVEFTMDENGMYPFVTHAFGDAVKGAIGVFKAGNGGPTSSGGH